MLFFFQAEDGIRDLVRSRGLGDVYKRQQENARLFSNLADQGYVDTRPRHWADEVQTFFREGRRPFQLDHVFADAKTESLVTSWRVLREPVESHDASDHAPIEIVIGHERDIQIG